jgi:FtsP/CotA-like multicopper oxidase with cupredoxin domain
MRVFSSRSATSQSIRSISIHRNSTRSLTTQNRIDRVLRLGGADEWTLQSGFVSHPFHIHVNPFQVVSITDPSGKDVSTPGAVDNTGGLDPQYPGLKGVWKDTLWIKDLISDPNDFPGKLATSMYHDQGAHTLSALYRRIRAALSHPRS